MTIVMALVSSKESCFLTDVKRPLRHLTLQRVRPTHINERSLPIRSLRKWQLQLCRRRSRSTLIARISLRPPPASSDAAALRAPHRRPRCSRRRLSARVRALFQGRISFVPIFQSDVAIARPPVVGAALLPPLGSRAGPVSSELHLAPIVCDNSRAGNYRYLHGASTPHALAATSPLRMRRRPSPFHRQKTCDAVRVSLLRGC